MAAARAYGDANENGTDQQLNYEDSFLYENSKRRPRHTYGQAVARNAASASLHPPVTFREFTRDSLASIEKRKLSRVRKPSEAFALDPSKPEAEPDPCLASGQQLPSALIRQMPPELVGKPIEDIDPYYADQETFVIISRGKELTRFSAKKALYLLGPFHPIRRIVLYILVNPIFNLFVIMTILINCILMTIQGSETVENTEIIFTIIYTTEMGLKVLARGFIVDDFTYLRDPWNWLDFMVIVMAYLTIVIEDLGNLSVMRTFRVLRALKTVAIIPGMKTIVGAVIDSVKNLKDVVVLTLFSLSVFSLLGLQIYMGVLTQKCVKNGPDDMDDQEWFAWSSNSSNWIPDLESEIFGSFRLCGNTSGAQSCPPDYTCLQGFGPNPDYGYTNFDTFGWALICSFRLMTQDFWEGLYAQILKTAGSWHIMFFIVSIFLGSIYLMNLILAIVAMSYNELQRRAEEEEEAAAEDEAAFLEQCRLMELADQMSQQLSDRSTPDPCTSYRPSVEIGLVGQSLLASLCQNGILDQRVRERLNEQMMLPGFGSGGGGGGGGANEHGHNGDDEDDDNEDQGRGGARFTSYAGNANRSHSLSVNLDNYRRRSSALAPGAGANRPSQPWLAVGSSVVTQQPTASAFDTARHPITASSNYCLQRPQMLAQAGALFDPFMMAASMTELRRKSSVRTNDSYSPTGSHTGSLLGQRRLLPNIGVTGNRLDRHSIRLRRMSQRLSPHYQTAGGGGGGGGGLGCVAPGGSLLALGHHHHHHNRNQLMLTCNTSGRGASGGGGGGQLSHTNSQLQVGRRLSRHSTSARSERDLEKLRQKAAMIRIVSDDCSGQTTSDEQHKNETLGRQLASSPNNSHERCNSDHLLGVDPLDTIRPSQMPRSSIQINPMFYQSRRLSSAMGNSGAANNSRSLLGRNASIASTSGDNQLARTSLDSASGVSPTSGSPSDTPVRAQPLRLHRSLSQRRSSRRSSTRPSRRSSTMSNEDRMNSSLEAPSGLVDRRRSTYSQCAIPAGCGASGGDATPPTQLSPKRRAVRQLSGPRASQTAAAATQVMSSSSMRALSMQQLQQAGPGAAASRSAQTSPLSRGSPANSTGQPATLAVGGGGAFGHTLAEPRTDRMHHLSVENFQQFGAIRPTVGSGTAGPTTPLRRRSSSNNNNNNSSSNNDTNSSSIIANGGNDHQLRADSNPARQRLHSLAFDGVERAAAAAAAGLQAQRLLAPHLTRRLQSMSGASGRQDGAGMGQEIYGAPAGGLSASQSLRQRGGGALAARQLAAVAHIHPSTMARSSFSRIRQSIVPGSSAATAIPLLTAAQRAQAGDSNNNYASHQPLQATMSGGGGGGGGVRRMSRDFVRHAGDWSRLSMSANVDLRRLLRLWSHTNPYQAAGSGGGGGPRPSIGSCSMYSQTGNQSYRGGGCGGGGQQAERSQPFDSPAHSIKQSGGGGGPPYVNQQQQQPQSPRPSSVNSWQAYEVMAALSRRDHRYLSDARAFGGALPLDDNLMLADDKLEISARDKCIAYCLSCLDVLCIWQCCGAWLKVQRLIALVVFDPFTELFIILCILINTLFMALDSDDADDQMRQVFERGNYFFTATFAVEAAMKIIALSPKFYFREGWNVFDSIIVGLSLLELGLEGVYGLSVLRSFRLLRVFKLAKSWPTLNLLISIMGKAVGDLGNLTFVLAIIVFIFAVMGMQLFGTKYVANGFPNGELPRWNFTDFMHSFMIVFRILCAEWIEPMWDCLLVAGWPCIPFFLISVTVGNLVVLNLFLALLLASFGASNLSSPQADNVDTKKLQEAIERFKRLGRFLKRRAGRLLRSLISFLLCRKSRLGSGRNSRHGGGAGGGLNGHHADGGPDGTGQVKSHIVTMSRMERQQNIERRTEELKSKIRRSPEHHYHLRQLARSQLKKQATPTIVEYQQHHDGQSSGGQAMPTMTIPIIVNEASEGDDVDGPQGPLSPSQRTSMADHDAQDALGRTGWADSSLSENASRPFGGQAAGDMTADEAHDITSLSSDISLNVISEADDDDDDCDMSLNGGDLAPELSPAAAAAAAFANDCQSIYSNGLNMQTIREDSHDDSCQSLNEPAKAINGGRQAGGVGARFEREQEDGKIDEDQRNLEGDDGKEDKLEEETMGQLREPLLVESTGGQRVGGHNHDYNHDHEYDHDVEEAPTKATGKPVARQQVTLVATPTPHNDDPAGDDDGDADRPKSSLYLRPPKRQDMEEEDEQTLQHIETYMEKCICVGIICLKWFLFRQYVRKIVEHKLFDQCILLLIIISSGTLALEDKNLKDRPTLKQTLDILDTIFTITFSLEMIFKWLAFGMRRYFGNIWTWLDFIIVLVSFVNLLASIFGSGKIQALKTMRTLRAMRGLRPLRALQRFQGMRVVVNALIQAIPSIFNVLLVCLIFWLIFSIMGVQMFGGKFWRCLDPETREVVSYEIASNRIECIDRNLTWANPQINFDNVLNAYLALFQVATFKGWIDIMNSATDSRMRDEQPIREANIYMYFYFVFFVIFGSFFTLNLFIGVIIDNFNEQKKKTGGSLEIFMTEDQKKYYHAMKKMRSKRPTRAMTRPKFKPQAYMFDITTSKRFDLAIMLIIGLNMFVMALEHYGQSSQFNDTLEQLNLVFITIFTLECICKLFAMRHFYFREPWNIFDFIVVSLSILGVVMKEYVAKYFVSPTLLRVVRVVKVGRVLRLVKAAKGIRTLLFALAMSLPALFNICLLLFLVMFIYAIFGMSIFMNVRKRRGLDDIFNFETFPSSIIVLFQMSTSAGWDLVLDPLMDEENDCLKADPVQGIEGTCGNRGIAIFFLVTYVIVTFLIIINMYIAVILENYSQATEDVQEGLTDDDYEMYYEIWQKFDPDGTQYLPYSRLSDFVDSLEPPLRIAKPNELALVVLDINIYEGNQCYCVDILDALTKYFFTRKGLDIQVNEHLQQVQSTLHETPFERITTTYLLKREHYCARVIQNCWRKWRHQTERSPAREPGVASAGGFSRIVAELQKQAAVENQVGDNDAEGSSGDGCEKVETENKFQEVKEAKQKQQQPHS